jgi:hypothetical protein
MDWGIVASVLVAITFFVFGVITVVAASMGLIAWKVGRSGGELKMKCPAMSAIENALAKADPAN